MTAVAALAGAAGCDGGEYTVAVRFPTAELRARTAAVEIYVAPACDAAAVARGAAPSRPVFTRALTATGSDAMSARLGAAVAPGHYGVWVRARAADCSVVAAGCAEYDLVAGGRAALAVALAPLAAPPAPTGCEAPGASCVAGICATATLDGGTPPDALDVPVPSDAPLDAALDTALDAPACPAGSVRCGNGACVDVRTDPANCGACGTACGALPGVASASCAARACAIPACAPGRADCDGAAATGCETDITSPANCGACGHACGASAPVCAPLGAATYQCTTACPAGTTLCAGRCADLASDASNCGACGTACMAPPGGTATCVDGRCSATCVPGTHACGGRCVPDTSATACGAACLACPTPPNGTAVCVGGACGFTCNAGYTRVGAACTMVCGNAMLDPGETCDDGNALGGDGCDPSCRLEAPLMDACAPLRIAVRAGTQLYLGTTTGAPSIERPTYCSSTSGPERFYELHVVGTSRLVITVTPVPDAMGAATFQPLVYVLRDAGTCPGPDALLPMCQRATTVGGAVTLPLGAVSTDVMLVVDTVPTNDGPYRLQISAM